VEHDSVGAELLTQRHWDRVLKLGATHFQHAPEFFGFRFESLTQASHRTEQLIDVELKRQLDCRRIDVICALPDVDVFVRVHLLIVSTRVAKDF
jgi:hypothetical protein